MSGGSGEAGTEPWAFEGQPRTVGGPDDHLRAASAVREEWGEWAVRWPDGEVHYEHATKMRWRAVDDLEAAPEGATLVRRTVTTTDWTEVPTEEEL